MAYLRLTDELVSDLSTERLQEEFYDSSFRVGGSFGVRVSKTGKKVFFLIYSLNGKRKRKTLGPVELLTLDEARSSAERLVGRARRGRLPADSKVLELLTPESFAELCRLFLERHAGAKLSDATRREYARMIERYLAPAWGLRPIRAVSSADVIHLVDTIRNRRESPVMAERVRSLVSKLYNFAIERELALRNPARRVIRTAPDERPRRIFTIEELARIWHQSKDEDLKIHLLFRLLILTGQRLSDLFELRFDAVSAERWTLKRQVSPAKTRAHVVLLPQPVLALLPQMSFTAGHAAPFVFPGKRVERLTYIRHASRRISARAALNPPVSPRDIRRSVRHHLLKVGIKPEAVKRMLDSQPADLDQFGYLAELREASAVWTKLITDAVNPPLPAGGKVISLFDRKTKE